MLSYREKAAKLAQTRVAQNQEKIEFYGRKGFFDTDDKGSFLPPEGWKWEPERPDPNGGWFGNEMCAKNFVNLIDLQPDYIDPLSSLAGSYCYKQEWDFRAGWPSEMAKDPEYQRLIGLGQKYNLVNGIGAAHHFHVDVDGIGLKLGWGGILEKIRHYQGVHKDDPEKMDFLKAEEQVILSIQRWIARHAKAARAMAEKETDPETKANLERMAAVNEKLVNDPPETYVEACQWLVWFIMESVMYNGSGAGGALETILSPYYYKDIAEGRLTKEEATYHMACLLVKDNTYFEIGGTKPDGSDRTDDISWIALEAAHWLKTPNALCLRIHEKIDPAFVRKAVEYLFEDKSGSPAFLGDRIMVEGFMKNGYSEELARMRVKTGCNWTALPGIEYTLNDVVKINMARVFEVAMWEMLDDADGEKSIARLWDLFDKHMYIAIRCIADSIDHHLENMHKVKPELALNFLCHGPIERGVDITYGGVDYYNLTVDGAGLGIVADSFACAEQRIEKEGLMTWEELAEYLRNNWEGAEDKRQLMRRVPFYGVGNTRGDYWAQKVVHECLTKHTKAAPTNKGFNMIPGLFSWANTLGMGKAVGATPNGRKAQDPITHGANPEPGFKEGAALTAMGIAVASVQPGWGNSAPIQLEVDPILGSNEDGIERITSFLMTYCNDLGGSLVNLNILDKDKIMDAHEHPERHPDLVVRVTGFSAYFNSLSKDFRQLVVDRIIQG